MAKIIVQAQDKSWLQPSIHPSYARILCSYIRNNGFEIEALFYGSTLSWPTLLEQQRFISFEQFRRIALNALKMTLKPWLGLEIAKLLQVSVHGSLGYGAVAAPTVKGAFKLIERAMVTRISLLKFDYVETDSGARFYVYEQMPLAELAQLIYPMLMGSFCDIVEKTTGKPAYKVKVYLPYSKPSWFEHYIKQFPEFAFEFDCRCFYVDIPNEILHTHSLVADEFAYRNAIRECQQLIDIRQQGGDLSEQIKKRLFSMEAPYCSQRQIAEELGMSVRTLIRKLKNENTSFQSILDEVRTELTCWQLQNTELAIEDIAESVGFIDTSNFSRVFKRWMGCTPSQFRTQNYLHQLVKPIQKSGK